MVAGVGDIWLVEYGVVGGIVWCGVVTCVAVDRMWCEI